MLDRVQGNGNRYFSQEASGYAQRMKAKPEQNQEDSKTIAGFAAADSWESLERRKQEALDKGKEQTASYILGSSARAAVDLEQWLTKGARKMQSMESGEEAEASKKTERQESVPETVAEELIQKLLGIGKQAPYSSMADENGVVTYHGVAFQCDYENNRICLGNVTNLQDCITVSLEDGGCLVVNRNNIDQLSKAIGMFSPEDVNRIMRAIAQDAKIRQTQMQIEDETSGVEVLEQPEDEKQGELSAEGAEPDDEKK